MCRRRLNIVQVVASIADEAREPSHVTDYTTAFKSKDKLHRTPEKPAASPTVDADPNESEHHTAVHDSLLQAPRYDDGDAFDVFGGIRAAESEVLPSHTPERPVSPNELLNQSLGLDDFDEQDEAQPIFIPDEPMDDDDINDEDDAPEPIFVPAHDEPDDNWLDQNGIVRNDKKQFYFNTFSDDHDILLPSTPAIAPNVVAPSRVFSSGFASPSKVKVVLDDNEANVSCSVFNK